jgi:hypothetical protein
MKFHCQEGLISQRFLLVSLIFSFTFFFPTTSAAQPRFDIPQANPDIGNPVPFHLVRKIAQIKAVEKWGSGALGDPIPLCDLDGNLTAYIFPFHIGDDYFPSYEEILGRIKEGRKLHEHLKSGRIEKAKEHYHLLKQTHRALPPAPSPEIQRALSDPQIGEIPSLRPDGSKPRSFEVAEIREIEKFAVKKAHGGDEFGALVVSATYDRVPVPVYYHRLPTFFTHQDLARERADREIGSNASLQRIYFLGMKGKVFEFENQRGKVLLHASSLERKEAEVANLRGIKASSQGTSSPEVQERRAKIREKLAQDWGTVLTEAGEKREGRRP